MTKLNWEAVLDQIDDEFIREAAENDGRRVSAHPDGKETLKMNTSRARRGSRRFVTLAAAVALLLALGVTAYAISSIHQRRQAELRDSLGIEENQVESYVEYDTGTGENTAGITLLSAVADGEIQQVYVNISPVSPEEVTACAVTEKFVWSIDGGNTFSFAEPYVPKEQFTISESDMTTFYDPDTGVENWHVNPDVVAERMLTYAYDEETQTLTLRCSILRSLMDVTKSAELRIWGITMRPKDEGGTDVSLDRDYGSVSFYPTGLEVRELMLDTPVVFENSETGECGSIEGLTVYPTGLTWLITHPDAENVYRSDWTEEEKAEYQPLQLSWLNSIEEALSGAKLNFTDGTDCAVQGILSMPFEGGYVKANCAWQQTINISAIEGVEIMGQTVGIRQK